MRRTIFILATLFVAAPGLADTTAFVNVNVIPMTSEIVIAAQTVVVEGGVITAIGSALGLAAALLALNAMNLPAILSVGWIQSPTLDLGLLGIAGATTAATIFLVGLAPALRSSTRGFGEELRDGDARAA